MSSSPSHPSPTSGTVPPALRACFVRFRPNIDADGELEAVAGSPDLEAVTGVKELAGLRLEAVLDQLLGADAEALRAIRQAWKGGTTPCLERPVRMGNGRLSLTASRCGDELLLMVAEAGRRPESEARFQTLFDSAGIGIAITDAGGSRFLDVNPALCAMVGRTRDEVLAGAWKDIFHPDEMPGAITLVEDLRAGRRGSYSRTGRYLHRDGHTIPVRVTVAASRSRPDAVDAFIGVVEDLSAQRSAEAQARNLNRQLSALFRLSGAGIVVTRLSDNRIVEANESMTQLVGWSRDELLGRTTAELGMYRHAPDRERLVESLRRGETTPTEVEVRTKDGSARVILASLARVELDGEALGLAMLQDVTGLRDADRERHRSEARFRSVFDEAAAGLAITDPRSGRFLEVNDALCRLLGYPRAELLRRSWPELSHPADAEATADGNRRLAAGERSYSLEKRYRHRDGHDVWAWVTVTAVRDATGAIDARVAIIQDLTERKQGEALQRLLGSALEAASEGVAITDPEGHIQWVNGALSRLTGRTREDLLSSQAVSLLSPPAVAPTSAAIAAQLGAGRGWRGETEGLRLDGSTYPQELSVTPIYDSQGVLTHVAGIQREISERRRAEQQVAETLDRYVLALDAAHQGTWRRDLETGELILDTRARAHFDLDAPHPTLEALLERAHPDDRASIHESMTAAFAPGGCGRVNLEHRVIHRTKAVRWLSVSVMVVFDPAGGRPRFEYGTTRDITDAKIAERALQVSQKMDAVGRLASGVAHDFNNLLCVVLSYTELTRSSLAAEDPLRADLEEVAAAARRGAGLTRQLLAFGRKQMLQPQELDLGRLVESLGRMLARLIGEDIELHIETPPGVHPVWADQGQIEQVVMNLAVNARDAMPRGGKLRIGLRNEELGAERAHALGLAPGPYVALEVVDTGTGMDAATRERIFEPFFTTKPVGKGTGLGLATVHGIVHQSAGALEVESEVGRGTCFRVLLPRSRQDPDELEVEEPGPAVAEHVRAGILVVEDEPALLRAMQRSLEAAGHRVVAAAGPSEASRHLERGERFDLAVVDVVMPDGGGRAVAAALGVSTPVTPILFVSGYTDSFTDEELASVSLLRKPFDGHTLLARVGEVLAAGRRP